MNRTVKENASTALAVLMLLALLALPAPPARATATPNEGVAQNGGSLPNAPTNAATHVQTDWGKMPLYFIANQGQLDERVAFYVQGSDKALYFAPDGVTFALNDEGRTTKDEQQTTKDYATIQRWIVKLDFVDANAVRPSGQAQTDAVISYFKGSRDEWRTGLPTYSQIVYHDLWEGIDLMYSGTVNRLKYEFVVQPGADPARIRLAYRGASVRVNDAGQLEVSTPAGGFHDDAPIAYQEVNGARVPVAVAYALDDDATYGFRLGAYDATLPLVIDPAVMLYATYIGGNRDDEGRGIALDTAGNVYITGRTQSTQSYFPVTVGPDLTFNGAAWTWDAFVLKVNVSGTALVYAGYIGGSGEDCGNGIAVDTAGNAYVVGITYSTQATFPVTVGPDLTQNGGKDAFVAKVNASGTALVYAGYIGGSGSDEGNGIAVDTAGNAYVVGSTYSTEATFPVTVGPDLTYNGNGDAYVAKVRADGTGLVYAGYIGGINPDQGSGIAVDAAGNAYVAGGTSSNQATFPVTVGPDLTYNSDGDAYVAKVRADGTGLVYCGYIGGDKSDFGAAIAIDNAGNAYIVGVTQSTQATFPVLVGPDLTHNGLWDAFVAKVRADGTGLVYCGYLGGSEDDFGNAIAVDTAGNAYITGNTDSTEATFFVTGGPDLTYNGNGDAFVAKVHTSGVLVYAGYIGGAEWDYGQGIAVNTSGNAYVTGLTHSWQDTFPTGSGFGAIPGMDKTANGYDDVFLVKISAMDSPLYLPLILR